jgi:hypothetical protein
MRVTGDPVLEAGRHPADDQVFPIAWDRATAQRSA